MSNVRTTVDARWTGDARAYFWGDPLDVRYHLCEKLSELRNKRVLDAGCNIGAIAGCIDASNTVIGVDSNAEAIAIAKEHQRPNETFIAGDFFTTPYEQPFDVIVLANVIPQHDFSSDRTPQEFMTSMTKLLAPGGTILLTTPNGDNAYYAPKNKILLPSLLTLFPESQWEVRVWGWNPFPMKAGHVLKFIPGIFALLAFLMRLDIRKERAISFYLEAKRKN